MTKPRWGEDYAEMERFWRRAHGADAKFAEAMAAAGRPAGVNVQPATTTAHVVNPGTAVSPRSSANF